MAKTAEDFLGYTFEDAITKFRGVGTGYVRYVSGCNQVLLLPSVDEKGEVRDAHWFDEQRLARQNVDRIVLDNAAAPGFDQAPPKR